MGKRSRHKNAKNRPLKVDPMNRLMRPTCSQCGARECPEFRGTSVAAR